MKKFVHFSLLCLLLAGLTVPMVACGGGEDEGMEGTAVTDDMMTTEPMDMTTEPMDMMTTDMRTDMTTDMTTEPPPAQ
jgi:hypothetical protein